MVIILVVMLFFFDVEFTGGNFLTAAVFLALGSISFVGVGMMAAILPLLYVERGDQMVFVIQSIILLFSGVYYEPDILPAWMQFVGQFSPGTYVLEGIRGGLIEGKGVTELLHNVWPLRDHGRRAHPAGRVRVRHRRALCQADRQAEEGRLMLEDPSQRIYVYTITRKNR